MTVLTIPAANDQPPPIPRKMYSGDGANSSWKISLADHEAIVARARDDERLAVIAWLEKWAEGKDFTKQGVATLILNDLIAGAE